MNKLLKVTLEFDDHVLTLSGDEAEKWQKYNETLATLAYVHNMNPFDTDPIEWTREEK